MTVVADALARSLATGERPRLVTPASEAAQRAAEGDVVSLWLKKGRRHLNPDTLAPEAPGSGMQWRKLLELRCPKCGAPIGRSGSGMACQNDFGCGFFIRGEKFLEIVRKMRVTSGR